MTKDSYFEMCQMLGHEPVEADIPVEFDDFPIEVQQAFSIYRMLRDEWDSFAGIYMGKSLVGIKEICEALSISSDDFSLMVMLIKLIDEVRTEEINRKKDEKPGK